VRSVFQELKQITDNVYLHLDRTGTIIPYGNAIKDLLLKHEIKLRNKDGKLNQINISIPKSKKKAIVVGLRYIKNDGSKTEDLFLFEEGKDIVAGYKGRLEKILPEYKGSHKLDQ
jgi:hypothetical protein